MRFSKIFPVVTIIISVLVSLYLYPYLPDYLATHWGVDGQVNGYSTKLVALFITPLISLFLYLLLIFLPHTTAYRKNFKSFDQYYYLFVSIIFAFLFYIYLLTLFWHLGMRFNMIQALSPGLFMVFFYAGHLSAVSKRNWFVGIRTPWTLKNDLVWEKTNLLGGRIFKIIAVLSLLTFFLPQYSLWFILYPFVIFLPLILVYSYVQYRRLS